MKAQLSITSDDLLYPVWVFFDKELSKLPIAGDLPLVQISRTQKEIQEHFWEASLKWFSSVTPISYIPSPDSTLSLDQLSLSCIVSNFLADMPYLIPLKNRFLKFMEAFFKHFMQFFKIIKYKLLDLAAKFNELSQESVKAARLNSLPQLDLKFDFSFPQAYNNVAIVIINNSTFIVPSVNQFPDLQNNRILLTTDNFDNHLLKEDNYGFIYDIKFDVFQYIDRPGIPIFTVDWCIKKVTNYSLFTIILHDLLNYILFLNLASTITMPFEENQPDSKNKTMKLFPLIQNFQVPPPSTNHQA